MTPPVIGSFALKWYAMMAQYTGDEEKLDYPLMNLVGAYGTLLDQIDDYVREGENGEPGWSSILDLDRAPEAVLPWLGQFVGVRLQAGLSETEKRQRIRSTDGFNRGTPGALRAAPAPYLTGSKTVVFRERDTNASRLTVITYASETPDPAAVLAALMAQKPGSIVLNYVTASGQDYQSLYTNYATYALVYAGYATYAGIYQDMPGV